MPLVTTYKCDVRSVLFNNMIMALEIFRLYTVVSDHEFTIYEFACSRTRWNDDVMTHDSPCMRVRNET